MKGKLAEALRLENWNGNETRTKICLESAMEMEWKWTWDENKNGKGETYQIGEIWKKTQNKHKRNKWTQNKY